MDVDKLVMEKALAWLEGAYDEQTKQEVKHLIDNDKEQLTDSFYKDLEFGTGGLRGLMGAGSNRMNIYTVGMATQGLSNYLKKNFEGESVSVAIAHDSRNNSRTFAEHAADIFASNGFTVYLFESLRPTPELSFAIRELGCKSGVVVTASHNPKEYNGYKAYWSDGSQVTSPHDKNIIAEVGRITSIDQIKTGSNKQNIHIIGKEMDEKYLAKVKSLSLSPEAVRANSDMKIVYTPLHGAGVEMVPAALRRFGFTNINIVEQQAVLDGDFPTVVYPNPEERATMEMALELGRQIGADIVLATDPDADRIAVCVPDDSGQYVIINGNQTCSLLTYYICRRWSENGKLDGKQYVVKTIVTSEMVAEIAKSFGIKHFDCLTGFKYIAEIIRNNEPQGLQYIGGGEESFGYLPEDFVRDKDGVSSCALAAEAAAWAKTQGMTLYGLLKEMFLQYGFYQEDLIYKVLKGKDGQEQIKAMMENYRQYPPRNLGGSRIVTIKDYNESLEQDLVNGTTKPIAIEKSNVLQFFTEDGTVISVRPSGTEPKIKYYFSVKEPLSRAEDFGRVHAQLTEKIRRIQKELELQ